MITITVEFYTLDKDICCFNYWAGAAEHINYLIETVGIDPNEIKQITITRIE